MIDTMPLADLLTNFTNGDQTGWEAEQEWIKKNHPRRLARIRREIQTGKFPAVRLCYDEKRVIDGHHRIIAALDLGLTDIPVGDAWGPESDWDLHAPDNGSDDPEDPPEERG